MQKERSVIKFLTKNQAGFSLAELLVAVAILGLLAAAMVGAITYGVQTTMGQGNVSRALLLAEEGLEATRNIRDAGFTNLVNGTYGLAITGNQWVLSGSSDTNGIFTRQIVISTINATTKQAVSTVSWRQSNGRQESTSATTYLINMAFSTPQADSLVVNTSGGSINGVEVRGITLQNTSAVPITIDRMTVSWTNASARMILVGINNATVWSGTTTSGTQVDITNVAIAANATIPLSRLRFNTSMVSGNTFTITFMMSDGTTKTVTYP